jgi:hypothetical protein
MRRRRIRVIGKTGRKRAVRKPYARKTEGRTDLGSPAAAPRLSPPDTFPAAYRTLVAGGSRLSEGAIIHATLRARVLGVNLLKVDATIEAAPGQLQRVQRLVPLLGSSARARPQALPLQGLEAFPRQGRALGSKLDQALGLLDEGAASLAAAKEDRSDGRKRQATSYASRLRQ